jgi:hypothetical protein
VTAEQRDHLSRLGIRLVSEVELEHFYMFERDGYVALVRKSENGIGPIGASGRLTECGFATLQWRGEEAFFTAKGFEERATPEQITDLRRFSADLRTALT